MAEIEKACVNHPEQFELSKDLLSVVTVAKDRLSEWAHALIEEFLYFRKGPNGTMEITRASLENPTPNWRIKTPSEAVVKIQTYCADLEVDPRLFKALGKTSRIVQINIGIFGDLGEADEFQTDEFERGMCVVLVESQQKRIRLPRSQARENIPIWELASMSGVNVFAGYMPEPASRITLTKIKPGTQEEQYLDLMRKNWKTNLERS